jgi:hypothetical protein
MSYKYLHDIQIKCFINLKANFSYFCIEKIINIRLGYLLVQDYFFSIELHSKKKVLSEIYRIVFGRDQLEQVKQVLYFTKCLSDHT